MTVILDNKMPNNMPNDMNAQQTDDNMKDFTTSPIVHLTSRAI